MSSIPRLAQALEEILGSAADDLARSTGFIQRQRAFSGSQFARTLVFGWLENPHATCDELADFASELGLTISPKGSPPASHSLLSPSSSNCCSSPSPN